MKRIFLAAAMVIPLQKEKWTELHYKNIPANLLEQTESGLKIKVQNSSSPLFYSFPNPIQIVGFKASLAIDGKINGASKGKNHFDEDSPFRMGLVATGSKTLSFAKRMFAADWVKRVFELAPRGVGLDRIYFFEVGSSPEMLGQTRTNPKNDLIKEEIIALATPKMELKWSLKQPITTAALWLGADGDDTHSSFTTTIESLQILTP